MLTGRTPGIPLDDRGRDQAAAVASRLAAVPLDAIVTSPLDRCRQTADAIAAARDGAPVAVQEDEQFAEVKYGDWTGKQLKRLVKEPLWRVVQAHPSAVRFPGEDAESMPDVQHRAVAAIRNWNARLGKDAVYLICSHGDVIKSVIADCLGLHLDFSQRIQVDPCSLTVIRYTPMRPFLVRMNDIGGSVTGLIKPDPAAAGKAAGNGAGTTAPRAGERAAAGAGSRSSRREGDAAIGGGAGG